MFSWTTQNNIARFDEGENEVRASVFVERTLKIRLAKSGIVAELGATASLSAASGHAIFELSPGVAELADALDSKSSGT